MIRKTVQLMNYVQVSNLFSFALYYYLILLFMVSCCNGLETMCTRLKSLALAHGQHQLYVPDFNVCFRCVSTAPSEQLGNCCSCT